MNGQYGALVCVLALGCGHAPVPIKAVTVPVTARMDQMSHDDDMALAQGTYHLKPGVVAVFDPKVESLLLQDLGLAGYSTQLCYLNNPGGTLYLVHSRSGNEFSPSDLENLSSIAVKKGAKVILNGRIPYKFGPDGKTPMVMPQTRTYEPEESAQVIPMEVRLKFKSPTAARQALDYIDTKGYRAFVMGDMLRVMFHAPRGAAIDEQFSFQFLAERFGGKVELFSSTIGEKIPG